MNRNLEASDAEDIVECPRPREGPITEEHVKVEPAEDDCVKSSSERAAVVADPGFLCFPRQ